MSELIYGIHAVRECLASGRRSMEQIHVATDRGHKGLQAIGDLARTQQVPVAQVDKAWLQRLVRSTEHQGVVAQVGGYPYSSLDEILIAGSKDDRGAMLVILDQIQDPHNLGAIARTALGCGAHGVVLTKHESVGVTPAVVKASAGAVEWIRIAQVTNLNNILKLLKKNNIWTVGLAERGEQTVYDYRFQGGHAVVMGGEGSGLRRLVQAQCDILLRIPLMGQVTSYNVSVATGMVLGEVMRQRA